MCPTGDFGLIWLWKVENSDMNYLTLANRFEP